jgi:hypothetical protein
MDVVIEFDPPAEPLSLNKLPGTERSARAWRAQKNLWKEAASWATVQAFGALGRHGPSQRAMPPCDVYVSIPVVGNHRRDAHNLEPTVKPIVDAIREQGVWPDDTDEWVRLHTPAMRPCSRDQWRREKVYVRLVPREDVV